MATNLEAGAVSVMRPPDIWLDELLEDMRSWLDNRRIETVGFNIAKGQFEVRFKKAADARRFERRFA
jgi:hypothetical protein